MGGIIQNKLNEQIEQSDRVQSKETTGVILQYNDITNTATIRFRHPSGEGTFKRDNVPITNSLGGLCGSAIRPGQKCTVSFRHGNVHAPIVTGIITNYYNEKCNTDQGACLVDLDINCITKPEITPMVNQWTEEENQNLWKYINHYSCFAETDINNKIYDIIRGIDKYTQKEQGITNLDTKSTIRLKENGDIDIFVSNNVGVRISPKNQTIGLYGSLQVNGKEIDLSKLLNDISDKE